MGRKDLIYYLIGTDMNLLSEHRRRSDESHGAPRRAAREKRFRKRRRSARTILPSGRRGKRCPRNDVEAARPQRPTGRGSLGCSLAKRGGGALWAPSDVSRGGRNTVCVHGAVKGGRVAPTRIANDLNCWQRGRIRGGTAWDRPIEGEPKNVVGASPKKEM